MPVLKLRNPANDEAVADATIAYLGKHGIPAGDAFVPAFVDTDEKVIYWFACVYPAGAEAHQLETGVSVHAAVLARVLVKYGLDSAAVDADALVAVVQRTPMLVLPPAEIVASKEVD